MGGITCNREIILIGYGGGYTLLLLDGDDTLLPPWLMLEGGGVSVSEAFRPLSRRVKRGEHLEVISTPLLHLSAFTFM